MLFVSTRWSTLRTRTLCAASLMIVGALVCIAPSAAALDCAATFPPSPPPVGLIPSTQWYATSQAYEACVLGNAAQAYATTQQGAITTTVSGVASDTVGLVNAGNAFTALSAYQASATLVGLQSCYNIAGNLCGGTYLSPTSSPQQCPPGVAIPPGGGGAVGNAQDISNGALQATCGFVTAIQTAIPSVGGVTAYEGTQQASLLGEAGFVAGSTGSLTNPGFDLASHTVANTCIYVTGMPPSC